MEDITPRIAFFNQKGGTGKTSGAINVAGCLAKTYHKKVLVVDGDPQANATKILLHDYSEEEREKMIYLPDYFKLRRKNKTPDIMVQEALIRTRGNAKPKYVGISVIGTKRDFYYSNADISAIRNLMSYFEGKFDYIIYDCPPSLSNLSLSILCDCDFIFAPSTSDLQSIDGFAELVDTVKTVRRNGYSRNVTIAGMYLTNIVERERWDSEIIRYCKEYWGMHYIRHYIRHDSQTKSAAADGTPMCWFAPTSKIAKDYENLTYDMLYFIEGGHYPWEER